MPKRATGRAAGRDGSLAGRTWPACGGSGARQPGRLGAGALDLVDRLGCPRGQHVVAVRGDQHVVFDANADAAQLARHDMHDLLGLRLLVVLDLLGSAGAEPEAALPRLLLAVLAQVE